MCEKSNPRQELSIKTLSQFTIYFEVPVCFGTFLYLLHGFRSRGTGLKGLEHTKKKLNLNLIYILSQKIIIWKLQHKCGNEYEVRPDLL